MNAWAAVGDETTNASIDFSNAISENTVAGTVNSMTLSGNFELGYTSGGNTVYGDVLRVGNGTGTVTIPEAQYAGNRDEIVITFDMYFGSLNNRNAGFYLYDNAETPVVIGALYCNKYNNTEVINSFGIDRSLITSVGSSKASNDAIAAATNKSTFEIHLNYASGTMYVKQSTNGTLKQTTTPVAMGSTNPLKRFVLQSNYDNTDRRCWFDNLVIKTIEGDYTVSSADYTVNWKCGNDVIKTETRTGDVGSSITLYGADIENFTQGGKRYIYVSDDAEGKTVADGGTAVVNITMREGAEYNYTVNAVDGDANVFQKLAEGSVFEDVADITVNTPWYMLKNGTLYYQNSNQKAFTVESNGQVFTVTYAATETTNVVYYSEAENISGGDSFGSNINSNHAIGRFQSATKFFTLAPGKYKIYTRANVGNGNSGDDYQNITFSDGTNNLYQVMTKAKSNTQNFTSDEITLSDQTDIYVHFAGSSMSGLDYIYIQKTGGPLTLNDSYYSTFSNAQSVQITGATAYVAKVNGEELVLTPVNNDNIVPAGTGVILKGENGVDVSYEVTDASADDVPANDLKPVLATIARPLDRDIYVLHGDEFWSYIGADLVAGKAYLDLTGYPSKLRMTFADDDATAINSVESEKADNGAIYNLAGQRVGKDYKGIVIKNGKKFMNK